MTTRPGELNFEIQQGDSFNDVWTITDNAGALVNLTGYTGRMFIRDDLEDASTLLEITTANSRMTLGGAAGTVTFAVSAALTAALPAKACVYDLELTSSGGIVTTWVRGNVVIRRKVTR